MGDRGGGGEKGGGGVLKFVKCLQIIFVFKQKIYCSFLPIEGVGGHTIGHIIGLNVLKSSPCYFQLALNFLCEKNCGSMNIGSWLA